MVDRLRLLADVLNAMNYEAVKEACEKEGINFQLVLDVLSDLEGE